MKKLMIIALGFFVMSAFTPLNEEGLKKIETSLKQIKQVQTENVSTLCKAVQLEEYDKVKALIEKGVEINTNKCDGYTPLILAITNNDIRMIKLLVSQGADVNMLEIKEGGIPLTWAVSKGNLDIVKYLVISKAEVNKPNRDGHTALMWAAENGYLDIVKYLVENPFEKARVNITDGDGCHALIYAAYNGHLDIVKYLVNNPFEKAIITITAHSGGNAIDEAKKEGHMEIAKYLEEQLKK